MTNERKARHLWRCSLSIDTPKGGLWRSPLQARVEDKVSRTNSCYYSHPVDGAAESEEPWTESEEPGCFAGCGLLIRA